MEFGWLGFIIGFLSGVVWCIIIGKIAEFIRFISMAKYQASTKGKEGDKLNELSQRFKEGLGTAGPGDERKAGK